MADFVYELMAKIGLDDKEYTTKLSKAGTVMKTFGTGIKTVAKVGAAAFAAVGAAAGAATTAIVKGANEVATYGDNIDKMSQKLGMSTDAYQEWDAVMQHCGTSIESMQTSMKTLATAAETESDAFKKLGISQEEIANMSEEELFEATIKALQNVQSETERTYLAGKLLGRGATELGPLLNMSAEETQAMRDRVHELGGVMSEEAVKAAAKYKDSLQDMTTAFSGLKRGLFAEFMPGITEVMDGLTEIFSGNSDKGIGMISSGLESLTTKIQEVMPKFIDTGGQIISVLVEALVENMPQLIEMGVQLLTQLTIGIVKALPALVREIPTIVRSMVATFKDQWPELKEAGLQLLKMVGNGILSGASWLKEKLLEIVEKIKDAFKFSWDFPKPKMPHFTVNWRDLGIISIPDISIEWYKKAYDNPYMFTRPTTVMGFGDGNGGEMVYGHDNLLRDIRSAVNDALGGDGATIVVQCVLDGRIISENVTKWQRREARAVG